MDNFFPFSLTPAKHFLTGLFLYAQALMGIIGERTTELRGSFRQAILKALQTQQWTDARLEAELSCLEQATPKDCESLVERYGWPAGFGCGQETGLDG